MEDPLIDPNAVSDLVSLQSWRFDLGCGSEGISKWLLHAIDGPSFITTDPRPIEMSFIITYAEYPDQYHQQ